MRISKGLIRELIKEPKCRKSLSLNEPLRNKYKGHRCFILGNGPSMNQLDLSKLGDEYVFCVNEFVRHEQIKNVNPNFYVLADPKFFDMDMNNEVDRALIGRFSDFFAWSDHVSLFIPLEAKECLKEYSWNCNSYFFNPSGYKSFDPNKKQPVDLTRSMPSMQAVVQYSIIIAVFMGFEKIYLIGTEQTNIFGNIKAYMRDDEINEYAFDMNKEERRRKNEKLRSYSLPETLRGYARIFELYESLDQYCTNHGIEIKNCARETLIQKIETCDYDTLF